MAFDPESRWPSDEILNFHYIYIVYSSQMGLPLVHDSLIWIYEVTLRRLAATTTIFGHSFVKKTHTHGGL